MLLHIMHFKGTIKNVCITEEKISMDVHGIKTKKKNGKGSNSSNEMESQHNFPLQLETQDTTHTW